MLFNSLTFAVFCLIVFTLYYAPFMRRWQPALLIAASFWFYGFNAPALLGLLVASIALNAAVSYRVAVAPERTRLLWAAGGVAANLALLGFFKYAGLLSDLVRHILHVPESGIFHQLMLIPLPIGISFYTFEGISLLVDVLRGGRGRARREDRLVYRQVAGERFGAHLYRTSLFIAFFPHLVAGPILRAASFYPQIGPKRFRDIAWLPATHALILGYFFKMVVADNLKEFTKWLTYPAFLSHGGITNFTVMVGYTFQFFADFAGYSLIAIGLGHLFGYTLPVNFNRPFMAVSVSDLWGRWHISLSLWLRDYFYRPLRGNRSGSIRAYASLFLVMALGGLWHGAEWHFLLWGAFHGAGLVFEQLLRRRRGRDRAAEGIGETAPSVDASNADAPARRPYGRILATFLFFCFGGLFFVLPEPGQVFLFLGTLARVGRAEDPLLMLSIALYSLPVVFYHLVRWSDLTRRLEGIVASRRWSARYAEDLAYGVLLTLIAINSGETHAFIYFQF